MRHNNFQHYSKREKTAKQMTKAEQDLRYIYAKLPGATEKELGILRAFIRGLAISGYDYDEYNRDLPMVSTKNKE